MSKYRAPDREPYITQATSKIVKLYLNLYNTKEVSEKSGYPQYFCRRVKPEVKIAKKRKRILELIQDGLTDKEISKKAKLPMKNIRRLRKLPEPNNKVAKYAEKLFKEGYGMQDVCNILGTNLSNLKRLLDTWGISIEEVDKHVEAKEITKEAILAAKESLLTYYPEELHDLRSTIRKSERRVI